VSEYKLGFRSRQRLAGVHPDLVAIVERAIDLSTQDFSVLCGVRTKEEQQRLYDQGRKTPGPIVTWTLNSRHLPAADGFGRAVDLIPNPVDWNDPKKFDAISEAMFAAAKQLGKKLRWGADWDMDGNARERGESDSPHFEIVVSAPKAKKGK
jgi:peptidoglycan L-alanyl-D-glutamate endopeptidase CwlK